MPYSADLENLLNNYTQLIPTSDLSSKNETHQDKQDIISSNENLEDKILKVNQEIIQEEEKQKSLLREKLTKTVSRFLWVQLIFFNLVILIILCSVTLKLSFVKTIDNELAGLMFTFLKYYISATVVELLGMLAFILHYVFSKYSGIQKK